jgi:DNA gyrase subunit B
MERRSRLRGAGEDDGLGRLADELQADLPLPLKLLPSGEEVRSWKLLLQSVFEGARKGYEVQRYKGLGEMNPEQLWETTMDPSRRALMKVVANDMGQADHIFSLLMGDAVDPRRTFIVNNALDVRNLDI